MVLAVVTLSSVRASKRSAKVSERALLGANLPLLVNSRVHDPEEKIRFRDDVWVKVKGGRAYAAEGDDAVYFVVSLRNVGRGLAVLDRWRLSTLEAGFESTPGELSEYRRLTRDLFVAPGDSGLWQGAIRDKEDPDYKRPAIAIANRDALYLDIEYADQEGGQRTISHFALTPHGAGDDEWFVSAARLWRIDGDDPR